MRNILNVVRLHLVDRYGYTWLAWAILAFTFVINIAIYAVVPLTQPTGNYTGAVASIYIFVVLVGVQAATKFLPFAFTLGVSRRTYYLGTVALIAGLSVTYSAILTVLWWVEGLTNGWGLQLHFFRVPWILDGPWYQVWLTSFAVMAVVFLCGLWAGLIYRRFGLTGSVVAYAALSLIVVAAALVITWRQAWPAFGGFVANLNILSASWLMVLLGVLVAAGAYLTIRRITV